MDPLAIQIASGFAVQVAAERAIRMGAVTVLGLLAAILIPGLGSAVGSLLAAALVAAVISFSMALASSTAPSVQAAPWLRGLELALRAFVQVSISVWAVWLLGPFDSTSSWQFIVAAGVAAVGLETAVSLVAVRRSEQRRSATRESMELAAEEEVSSEQASELWPEKVSAAAREDAKMAARYRESLDRARDEVELLAPRNPRTAKRMMNHFSLVMAIAEERQLFDGGGITRQQVAKWVGVSEQWPSLASALTSVPTWMSELEAANELDEMQRLLDERNIDVRASAELFERIRGGVPLGQVLESLVRFEPRV